MRVALAVAIASGVLSVAMADPALAAIRKPTNIQAQSLGTALQSFAAERELVMVYRSELVLSTHTSGATGELTLDEALTQLLSGTNLTYKLLDEKTVTIVPLTAAKGKGGSATPDAKSGAAGTKSTESRPPQRSFWDRFRLAEVDRADVARDTAVESGGVGSDARSSAPLEEITVTAQKREERLHDVPVPVTAITGSSLAVTNQVRLQDFYSRVPGFSVAPSPGAGGQQSLSIRGISTGSFTVPTVGITVDDVPYGSSTNFAGSIIPDFDPSDLARIEVLRGPQGTLYGASSMGGLLKFVTVDPNTDAVSGRVEAGLSDVANGSGTGYSVRGAVNVPLADTFAIRASGFTREVPGYIDNPFLGATGVNEQRVSGGRLSGLWRPSDSLTVKLSALYQDDQGDASNEVNLLPGLGDLEQSYIRNGSGYERKTQAFSAAVSAKLGRVDLVSITGYNVNKFSNTGDSTYSLGTCCTLPVAGVEGSPLETTGSTKKFTQEVRATLPLGARVELLLGGFYTHEDSPYRQLNFATVPLTGQLIAQTWDSTYPSVFREYGEFATLTINFSDRFDLQLGGREAQIRQKFGPCVYTGPLFGDGGCPYTPSSANSFTYLVTPRLKLTPEVMVYARAASGYRAGGPNVFNPNPAIPRQYEPDKTQSYEVGVKAETPGRTISVDASLFRIDFKDLQINLLDTSNFLVYTANGSEAKSQGIELSLEARPLEGLTISAWGTYTDAVLTQPMPPNSSVFGLEGSRLPYSSRVSGSASVNQEFPLTSSLEGFAGATVSYVGDRQGTFIGTANRQVYPSYTKIDLVAGVRYDSWTTTIYGNNIGDKRGVLGGGAGTYPPFAFTYLQPRTVGLSVAKNF